MSVQLFEFRVFPADEFGQMDTKDEFVLIEAQRNVGTARSRAGRLAKLHNGPVDLAYAYKPGGVGQDWSDRYITTASPCEYTTSGFQHERLI